MKKLSIYFICTMFLVALTGCTGSNSTSTSKTEENVATQEVEKTQEPAVVYAKDKVVNQFITDYNAITKSEFTDIEKGNIRTKYFGYSYGYYCELLNSNATGKINVTIMETNENADLGVNGMREIFRDVVATIDPSLTDESIFSCFDELIKNDVLVDDVKLGTMNILFAPDKELSRGHSRGHIEISAE